MITWINAAVWVAVENVLTDSNDPVYICYDENRKEVGRCHSFEGTDGEVIFEPRTDNDPARVLLKVNGPLELDTEFSSDFNYTVIPSSTGMYATPVKPITVEKYWGDKQTKSYTHVTLKGQYFGRYDKKHDPILWVAAEDVDGIEA
jgi:hypothetical protein